MGNSNSLRDNLNNSPKLSRDEGDKIKTFLGVAIDVIVALTGGKSSSGKR